MSSAPFIHKLKRILLDFLSEVYIRLIKAISSAKDILPVDIELKNNHRDSDTIVISNEAKSYLNILKSDKDFKFFFSKKVNDFFLASAKYVVAKFDLKNPLSEYAGVADSH